MKPLRIGGLTPLTTIDFPDQLAAVVFCQGCPWRCRYCQNPQLLRPNGETLLLWQDILAFLKRRRGLLDAVVFSGGEPTQQAALSDAMREVKAMGLRVGLHTAGIYPKRLENLFAMLDWVGLDIKADALRYPTITGIKNSGVAAWRSAQALINSATPHEIRLTFHQNLLPPEQLEPIIAHLCKLGASSIILQPCRTQGVLDPTLRAWPAADSRAYQQLLSTDDRIKLRS
jgi:pyruvate formate lyase activating enzyme